MTLGILLFPQFQLLDAAGPIGAFEIAARIEGRRLDLALLAAEDGPVTSSCGVALAARGVAGVRSLDTVLVVGGEGVAQAVEDARLVGWLRRRAPRLRRIVSVCSGAFLLAQAGLLDGRSATTHWHRSAEFARRYPRVRLEPDRIFVRDGCVWSSAGITAGIDLALALIAEDHGPRVAQRTAQHLVVPYRRPGGQSQFSSTLELDAQGGRFGELLAWARERLDAPLGVEVLAARAAMSPRNFARVFTADMGVTPARAIARLRAQAARTRLEAGREPIEVIARRTGFNDAERMRRAFVDLFGQSPQALRRAARGAGDKFGATRTRARRVAAGGATPGSPSRP